MQIRQDPPEFKNCCFYYTKDMEQKYFPQNSMVFPSKSCCAHPSLETIAFTTFSETILFCSFAPLPLRDHVLRLLMCRQLLSWVAQHQIIQETKHDLSQCNSRMLRSGRILSLTSVIPFKDFLDVHDAMFLFIGSTRLGRMPMIRPRTLLSYLGFKFKRFLGFRS